MTGRLLTGRQVADLLGVSTKTVLRWALEGELPSIRLSNRAIRFRQDQLEQWLEQRTAPARGALTTTPDAAHPRLSSIGLTTINHEEQQWQDS
jgi:excisionase family DNA binding protein